MSLVVENLRSLFGYLSLVASDNTRKAIWLASGLGGRGVLRGFFFDLRFFAMGTVSHDGQENSSELAEFIRFKLYQCPDAPKSAAIRFPNFQFVC